MLSRSRIARHKIRFDRGGNYLNYLSILFTGGTFLKVFGAAWWLYPVGVVAVVAYRYVTGYIEEKSGILGAEQSGYFRSNPEWEEMKSSLERIENILKDMTTMYHPVRSAHMQAIRDAMNKTDKI